MPRSYPDSLRAAALPRSSLKAGEIGAVRLAAKRAAGRRELGLGHPLNPATLRREVRALHADHVNLGGALPLPALDALSRRPLCVLARQLVRANEVLEAAR